MADPSASPRPRQMIQQCLSAGYSVSLHCLPSAVQSIEKLYPICKSYRKWKWKRKIGVVASSLLYFLLRKHSLREKSIVHSFGFATDQFPIEKDLYDAVVVQDLFLLPYFLGIANRIPVVFDAREFYPKQREGNLLFDVFERPLRNWICKEYLPRCAKVLTVSNGLARAYKDEYGVTPTVVRSTPPFRKLNDLKAKNDTLEVRLVHIGAANPNRKIENMIEIFCQLQGNFIFDLYLVGEQRYIQKLKKTADGVDGLRICEPIAPDRILNTMEDYDIGFYYLEPKGFNLAHCLPNKFFEFIQARLAIAIGPSPEMKMLVEEFSCGFVAPEFTIEAMARTLNAISSENLQQAKKGSEQAAQVLCSEIEWQKVNRVFEELIL
jgi:glycosyltransferase involved in cell wall biosynthesis